MKSNFIHDLADVQSVNIGEGTYVWQFSIILKRAVVGSNCNINCNVFIENSVVIGNNVTIKPGVQIWDGITIEDNVFIGPNVTFTNDLIPRSKNENWELMTTTVRHGATIGANSTILPNIEIGKFALIGAGSVITKSLPPCTVWYGNPAKHEAYITPEGEILNMNLFNEKTNEQYKLINFIPVKSND